MICFKPEEENLTKMTDEKGVNLIEFLYKIKEGQRCHIYRRLMLCWRILF